MKQKIVSCSFTRAGVRAVAIALALISSRQVANAVPVTVEAGVAIVETSGLRRYAAQRFLTENRTSTLSAPQLRVSVPAGDSWAIGAGYGYYATFRGFGVAPTPDIFDQGGIWAQVITPFTSAEKIHEASVDLRYRLKVAQGVSLELGPTASLFHSRARIAWRSFTENDVRLGGAINFVCPMNERWAVRAGYRYAAPPDRTLHILSLTIAREF